MAPAQRQLSFLKQIVREIYQVLRRTEYRIYESYPVLKPTLPADVTFIHAEALRQRYPDLSAKERENAMAKEYGAIFIIGIGTVLGDGSIHDARSPDYDDYTTMSELGHPGLNGDLLVWHDVLDRAVELSSMGIRVNPEVLAKQLELAGENDRSTLYFHRKLLAGELPQTIGGGIGQSRLCMVLLQKAHIGEIQASIWPESMHESCQKAGITLL